MAFFLILGNYPWALAIRSNRIDLGFLSLSLVFFKKKKKKKKKSRPSVSHVIENVA